MLVSARSRLGGFSLVEVVMAIGIIAFAFVALLGMLPTGLNTFRKAMDTSVSAQIAQKIAGELQETDYFTLLEQAKNGGSDLRNMTTNPDDQFGSLPIRYFDDQGSEIVTAGDDQPPTEAERLKIIYEAHVRLSRRAQFTASGERIPSENLVTAIIQVANNPRGLLLKRDSGTLLLQDDAGVQYRTYPAALSRNGSQE